MQVASRTKGRSVTHVLGRTIHPAALSPVERHLLTIHGKKILPEKFTQFLEHIAKPSDDRIVTANGMLCLGNIPDIHHGQHQHEQPNRKDKHR